MSVAHDDSTDEEVTRSDLVHERLRESQLKRWILLDGNRYLLVALFSAAVFVITLGRIPHRSTHPVDGHCLVELMGLFGCLRDSSDFRESLLLELV